MGFVSPFGSTVVIAGAALLGGATFLAIEKGHEEAIRVDRARRDRDRAEQRNRQLMDERRRLNDRVRSLEKQLEELRRIIEEAERK
jgi:chromosome segregation ATPase